MMFGTTMLPLAITSWVQAHPVLAGILFISVATVGTILYRNWTGIRKFAAEVQVELIKCNWPWDQQQTGLRRYKELVDSTILVIVFMILFGAYTGLGDMILARAVSGIIDLGI